MHDPLKRGINSITIFYLFVNFYYIKINMQKFLPEPPHSPSWRTQDAIKSETVCKFIIPLGQNWRILST
jgi:hypothetical protein